MTNERDSGQIFVIVAMFLVVLMGCAALAIDIGDFRAHRRQMQTAADAGALAGAMQLPPFSDGSQTCSRASYYERQNSNLTNARNLIVNGNLDTSSCTILGQSVRVAPVEDSVPYAFGRVLGFINTDIHAQARARVVYLTRSEGLLPFGVEDLRPKTVTVFLGTNPAAPVQSWSLQQAGCNPPTPEGYPYWCSAGAVHVNSGNLPAGGLPVGIRVVDNSGKVVDWQYIGYVGAPQSMNVTVGKSVITYTVDNAVLNPMTTPYYYRTSQGGSIVAQVHISPTPTDPVQFSYAGAKFATAAAVPGSPGWFQLSVSRATAISTTGQDLQVRIGNANKSPVFPSPVLHTYAADDGDILQNFTQSNHFMPTTGGDVSFQAAFLVLVKGKIVTLKLGGGGAQGNSGNYQGLDLDTNTSWGQYACYANSGIPNTADEVQHGSCTPYSVGDTVETQTGNFAGQVDNGLDARINGSPNNWTTSANPPPPGDPRWMSLILVPPITFSNCNGTCTTVVTGFGSFYVTAYGKNDGLQPGEVRGVFWDRPVRINQYSTTCDNPEGICLASVALMPWNG